MALQISQNKMYIHRTLEKYIKESSATFPVVMITGPRQVGKTSVLKNLAGNNRTYVSLDSPKIRELAQRDPELFMQNYPPPVLIDEVQYAPELFTYIKIAVDKDRTPGAFWLTGSQQFHLMKNVSESLAGRIAILKLSGLTIDELQGSDLQYHPFLPDKDSLRKKFSLMPPIAAPEVYEKIWRGSLPEIATNEDINWNVFYESYTQSYIQRDVRDLVNITDESSFIKFMRTLAALTSQTLNYNELSASVGVSNNTIKSWISILQTSGIIYLLEPYFNNHLKRLIKTPKVYFLDTGLCCNLAGWPEAKLLANGAMSGAIFETYVVSQIVRSYWHNAKRANLSFYRDKDKREIDLVIEESGKLFPVEIKKTAGPNLSMASNFKLLENTKLPIGRGGIVCLAQEFMSIANNIDIIPVSLL